MRPRKLHVAGALILAAWVASVGWLVKREYFSGPRQDGLASARVAPGSHFFAVYRDGAQVGFASITVDTVGAAVRIAERYEVLLAEDSAAPLRQAVDIALTPSLALERWEASASGSRPMLTTEGRVEQPGRASLAVAQEEGARHVATVSLNGALPLSALLVRLAVEHRLDGVDSLPASVLDPLTATAVRTMLGIRRSSRFTVVDSAAWNRAAGRWEPALLDTVQAWPVTLWGGHVTARAWIDAGGRIVRALLPNGLALERTAFEMAQLNFRDGHPGTARLPSIYRPPTVPMPPPAPSDTAAGRILPGRTVLTHDSARAFVRDARTWQDTVAGLVREAGASGEPAALRRLAAAARWLGIPARVVGGAELRDGAWHPAAWVAVWHDGWAPLAATPDSLVREPLAWDIAGLPHEYVPLLSLLPRPRT